MGRDAVKTYCYDNQGRYVGYFDSLAEAGRNFKAQTANISVCIKLGIKCRGFYFSTEKLAKYPAHDYRRGGQPVAYRKEGGWSQIWHKCATYSEASEATGVAHSTIRKAVDGRKYAKGYYFKKLPKEEYPQRNTYYPPLSFNKKQPVMMTKNGKSRTFESIIEASRKLNVHQSSIRNTLAGRWSLAGGYVVKRINK